MISGQFVGENETMRLMPDCSRLILRGDVRLCALSVVMISLFAGASGMSCTVSQSTVPDAPLIYAAASLADVAEDIAESFQDSSGNTVRFTFGGSNQAASQIVDGGAPVDAVWFAGWTPMSRLSNAGLITEDEVSRVCFNKLVVVSAGGDVLDDFTALSELEGAGKVAIPDADTSPAGEYAKSLLELDGVWSTLGRQIVPTLDVRAALSAVTAGVAEFAVVYETDALTEDVEVVFVPGLPPSATPPTYYAAKVSESTVAMEFIEYLTSGPAQAILDDHGFLSVGSVQ